MNTNHTESGVRWTTISEYVDKDTGEKITKTKAEKEYIIIKKRKHYDINKIKTAGTITITNECTRNPQTKLW